MVRIVNATEAKNKFGEIIKHAYLDDEHLIVKRGGIPVVAIVPMADYERLANHNLPAKIGYEVGKSARQERARLSMRAFLEDLHHRMPGISEKEANKDIKQAIQAVRAKK